MGWSTDEISNIRALVADLLDDIGLKSYEFNIEQDQNNWIVSADFPHRGQWQTVDLRVDKTLLRHCLTHEEDARKIKVCVEKQVGSSQTDTYCRSILKRATKYPRAPMTVAVIWSI